MKKKIKERIVISFPKKGNVSLKEKFEKYNGKNLTKCFSWGKNVGKENKL